MGVRRQTKQGIMGERSRLLLLRQRPTDHLLRVSGELDGLFSEGKVTLSEQNKY
jgi:hypothetical protein